MIFDRFVVDLWVENRPNIDQKRYRKYDANWDGFWKALEAMSARFRAQVVGQVGASWHQNLKIWGPKTMSKKPTKTRGPGNSVPRWVGPLKNYQSTTQSTTKIDHRPGTNDQHHVEDHTLLRANAVADILRIYVKRVRWNHHVRPRPLIRICGGWPSHNHSLSRLFRLAIHEIISC